MREEDDRAASLSGRGTSARRARADGRRQGGEAGWMWDNGEVRPQASEAMAVGQAAALMCFGAKRAGTARSKHIRAVPGPASQPTDGHNTTHLLIVLKRARA